MKIILLFLLVAPSWALSDPKFKISVSSDKVVASSDVVLTDELQRKLFFEMTEVLAFNVCAPKKLVPELKAINVEPDRLNVKKVVRIFVCAKSSEQLHEAYVVNIRSHCDRSESFRDTKEACKKARPNL